MNTNQKTFALACVMLVAGSVLGDEAGLLVGAAKVDVTPRGPIRLCGYIARKSESDGVERPLFARAVAIGTKDDDTAVLVTLDTTAIPASLTEDVAARLRAKAGIARERFVLSCTHNHSGPCVHGALVNIFGMQLPPDQQKRIEDYSRELADKLEQVALDAVRDRKPATLSFGRGGVGFAANRRRQGGPVDHALPVLVARDGEGGKVRAVVANYACHNTTLGGDNNKVCTDWAGFACAELERRYPGAVALVTIGCGGDQNPKPRGTLALTEQHGKSLAEEAARLIDGGTGLRRIAAAPEGKVERIELHYDKLPTREELEKLAKLNTPPGYNARTLLAKLDRGEQLPETLPYVVQSWTFGNDLAMVFLAGEVVVDYAVRLKHEFDPDRLWVSAYSNDVPCYIPSKRILAEGGYEAGDAMVYYGRPTRLAPAVENDIVRAVHRVLPVSFRSGQSLNEFPPPKSPADALASFRLRPDLAIDVAAAEPLVVDPIAIDWDARGRLWVLEMHDYPTGLYENGTPGGRVVVLEDTDHDGRYDKRTVFLDRLKFPMGLMCWRNGVLVCAAPDILFARDTDGDGRADSTKVLFSGFSPENQQWEVNGLGWGLDNWVYGAGSIRNNPVHVAGTGRVVEIGGRDFRMDPDTLAFEPASGRTQFCRVRDDFGDWFGNDNSNPLWHYPLEDRYVRRNPFVTPPPPRVYVAGGAEPNRVYPVSRLLERFNSPGSANHVTSGCGPGIYRDRLLGEEFYGNAFYCEPVHNLVSRLVLTAKGATFEGHRADGEESGEFLASADNWCRPVHVRTGPDGALWVVDMYRFVIEHPRWIPPERLSRVDTRAGADMGRIYRVYPKGKQLRPVEDLAGLPTAELARRIDTPNGTVRDLVHRELSHRQDAAAAAVLETVAKDSREPAARVQALCALDGLGKLDARLVRAALADPDAGVRRNALRLAEPALARGDQEITEAAIKLAGDADAAVRFQAALSLGESSDARVADALGSVAAAAPDDPWARAAVLNAALHQPLATREAVTRRLPPGPVRDELARQLAALAAATAADEATVAKALSVIAPQAGTMPTTEHFASLAAVLDALDRHNLHPDLAPVGAILDAARSVVANPKSRGGPRAAALRLLGRDAAHEEEDVKLVQPFLQPTAAPSAQSAALAALGRMHGAKVAETLLAAWPRFSPAVRTHALEVLTSRPAWAAALLKSVQKGKVLPSEIPAAEQDKLLKSSEESVRSLAASALARPTDRAQVLKQFQSVLKLRGNPTHGREIFARTCATCHQLNTVGNAVGPSLNAVGDRSTAALLTAILDPNAAVEARYLAYAVETTDGRTLAGLITDETAAGFTVLQGNAVRDTVSRSQVKRMYCTKLSLMPEGLEAGMTAQDLSDLISFVQLATSQ